MIGIEIDKLTNSVEEQATGESLSTIVKKITPLEIETFDTWIFDWRLEEKKGNSIYKLILEEREEEILGLISISLKNNFVLVDLIESSYENIGRSKKYLGIAGNLFAFACKLSFDKNMEGIVSFTAKTNLIDHYSTTLKAQRIGNSHAMFIYTDAAKELVQKYFPL